MIRSCDIPIKRLERLAPKIRFQRFPEAEKDLARSLQHSLMAIEGYVEGFASALALFDLCEREIKVLDAEREYDKKIKRHDRRQQFMGLYSQLISWLGIAARDGAMTIWHFSKAIQTARALANKCPTMQASLDRPRIKSAFTIFNCHFTCPQQIRDSVAHEFDASKVIEESYIGHGVALLGQGSSLHGIIYGRSYATTYKGKVISYELSQRSLDVLVKTESEFFAAFVACPIYPAQ